MIKYVIIGAGPCGVSAARSIREADPGGSITILGEEQFLPYYRYRLTDFLTGSISEEDLFYVNESTFNDLNIKFRKGEWVKAVNPPEKEIKLAHNEVIPYDRLLIATGARPGLGPILSPYRKLIHTYYSLVDIYLLKRHLPEIKQCLVYGTGLSSLDLIRGLIELGKEVTYLVSGEKPDWSLLEPEVYDELLTLIRERGIKLMVNDRLVTIGKKSGHYIAGTFKRVEIRTDLVFAWDHYQPNISFLNGTSLQKKTGILVNKYLQTSDDHIYAAGDCVEIYDPKIKKYWINFGGPNAQEQGTIVGKNMTGQKIMYNIKESITVNLMGKALRARWWK